MPSRTSYSPLISATAEGFALDANLVEAVVLQESGGRTDAFRFEPKFYARYLAHDPAYAGMDARRISSSYGLMQVMYPVAVELGFEGEPEELFVPRTGLHWGCAKLASLFEWARGFGVSEAATRLAALAAYNGGKADNAPGHQPMLRNGAYARSVESLYRSLRS